MESIQISNSSPSSAKSIANIQPIPIPFSYFKFFLRNAVIPITLTASTIPADAHSGAIGCASS